VLNRFGPHAANVLTAARVLLTPLFVMLIWNAQRHVAYGIVAGVLFAVIAASDVVDGRLARRFGSATNGGRTFDHLADIGFIVTALSTYAALGITPWWVPAAIAGSFAFYVIDSWSRPTARGGLVGSRVGHAAGVCNYVLIGVLVYNNSAGIDAVSGVILALLFCLVPIYSALAVLTRLSARTAPAAVGELMPE
jgi:CDP-diacylglycerol--glycerol-3-phosphate 3-phosphatidyltransferase